MLGRPLECERASTELCVLLQTDLSQHVHDLETQCPREVVDYLHLKCRTHYLKKMIAAVSKAEDRERDRVMEGIERSGFENWVYILLEGGSWSLLHDT